MAEPMVLTDCYIKLGDVEYTNGTSIALAESTAAVDVTTFGDGTTVNDAGKKSWSLGLEFNGKAGELSALMGTVVAVEVRQSADVVSVDNPSWTGNGLVNEVHPIDGGISDAATVSVTILSAGALTMSTVPAV